MAEQDEGFDLSTCAQLHLRRAVAEILPGDIDELLTELAQRIEGWEPEQGFQPVADVATHGDLPLLLQRMRRQLDEEVRRASARLFSYRALALLRPHVDFDPPAAQVEQELERMMEIAARDGAQLSADDLQTLLRSVVHRQLVDQHLLARLALATGIRPDGPELTQAMEAYAERYGMTRKELLADGGLAMEVANELYQELVIEAAFADATITEEPMTRSALVAELRRALLVAGA